MNDGKPLSYKKSKLCVAAVLKKGESRFYQPRECQDRLNFYCGKASVIDGKLRILLLLNIACIKQLLIIIVLLLFIVS